MKNSVKSVISFRQHLSSRDDFSGVMSQGAGILLVLIVVMCLKDESLKLHFVFTKKQYLMGWSPGLVVMGGDSCSKDREFESLHCILDGYFSRLFVVKNCNGWPIF